MEFQLSENLRSLEIFRIFLDRLERLKEIDPESIDRSTHFFTKSESKVFIRTEWYIRKEVTDLKSLANKQDIQSSIIFSERDLYDCDAVNIIFSLQQAGLQGSTRYHYDVYRVQGGFYLPKFSASEKMNFFFSLVRM